MAAADKRFRLKMPVVLERVEQTALIQWAEFMAAKDPRLKLLNASLNGVRLSPSQAILAKQSGMKKGYPDLFLPVPNRPWCGLFIEMKRKDGTASDVSKEQRQWIEDLQAQNYKALVCYGWEDAAQVITQYLRIGSEAV